MMNYPLIKTLRNLIAFWELTTLMAGRDMRALNRGSLIGIGWLVLRPMLQVSIYVVIIGYVFSLRLPNDVGNFGYVLHVLSGIVVWQFMQKLFEYAPSLIRDKTEFFRQVVSPMETLPVTSAMIGIPALGIGIVVFIVIAALDQVLNVSILALPIELFFLCFS